MQRSSPVSKTPILYWIALALILGLAAFLRAWQVDASSLWSDEGNTWALMQRSFAQIATDAAADIHPPGYYWLLKVWTSIFGLSAAALRGFSVLCGVLLVGVIERIGRQVAPDTSARVWLPLLAALLAALNPFQIYYSQEARMYMLLTLASALLMSALLMLLRLEDEPTREHARSPWRVAALYTLAASAGLWTHYSFPIVLLAAGVAWLVWWLRRGRPRAAFWRFAAANGAALLLFAPWLPTAVRQLTTWPQGGEQMLWSAGAILTLRTLLLGLMHEMPAPQGLWLGVAALLPVLGILALRRQRGVLVLALWLLLPIGMMAALGLFTDAFLKFLLVASAPWCILVAAWSEIAGRRLAPILRSVTALGAVIFALLALPPYYGDALARDNYAGVARYLAAAGDPQTDLVLLNAPGQADVWAYYDPGIPVLALPATRPLDAAATVRALEEATAGKRAVYALLWATDEADPENVVTNWLDANLFKGQEVWQNNVRFAQYFGTQETICTRDELSGGPISLLATCSPDGGNQTVSAGEPYIVQFEWRADEVMDRRYKVSVQILDTGDRVLAQHDSEPAGGSRPTTTWQVGEIVTDRHAVLIPIGTLPKQYTVRIIVYDSESGERLQFGAFDYLGQATYVMPPEVNPPLDLLPMQHVVDVTLGDVRLLGYSQQRKDFAHAPETPVQVGDTLQVILYWQAPDPLPASWQQNLQATLTLSNAVITAPLAGVEYHTERWQPGQIVRAIFEMPWDGTGERRVHLHVGDDSIRLAPLP